MHAVVGRAPDATESSEVPGIPASSAPAGASLRQVPILLSARQLCLRYFVATLSMSISICIYTYIDAFVRVLI